MLRIDDLGYPVVIDRDVSRAVAEFARSRKFTRIAVLCDKKVASHAERICGALKGASVLPFALGERRKTLATVTSVLETLAVAGVDRRSLIIGLGGGVATDLFGFAAATYMRGVAYVNVATSLVAMVDAAIGGKTGVDLAAGKNLAGVFRDPAAVFCDLTALGSLGDAGLREGLAEIVKHGIIEGGEVFESLETLAAHPLQKWPWEKVIADSIRIKAMIVNDDRVESGSREILNLGHTFAHALERASGYRTAHGAAVAVGLRAAGLLALRTGRFSDAAHLRVLSLLTLLKLPLVAPVHDPGELRSAMAADKKAHAGILRFVLPRAIGDVEFGITVPAASLHAVLARIVRAPSEREFR